MATSDCVHDQHSQRPHDDLATVRRIVLEGLGSQRARVFLFGSRARGTATLTSDIDIALVPEGPLAAGTLAHIREALEESAIPYAVEVVDLSDADESFRRQALAEAISWND